MRKEPVVAEEVVRVQRHPHTQVLLQMKAGIVHAGANARSARWHVGHLVK